MSICALYWSFIGHIYDGNFSPGPFSRKHTRRDVYPCGTLLLKSWPQNCLATHLTHHQSFKQVSICMIYVIPQRKAKCSATSPWLVQMIASCRHAFSVTEESLQPAKPPTVPQSLVSAVTNVLPMIIITSRSTVANLWRVCACLYKNASVLLPKVLMQQLTSCMCLDAFNGWSQGKYFLNYNC